MPLMSQPIKGDTMRAIETRIVNAIRQGLSFKQGSTRVVTEELAGERVTSVYLHGHLIATVDLWNACLRLSDAGYQTVTTKSRLNALLLAFAPACCIQQDKGVWWLRNGGHRTLWDGHHGFVVTE